MNNTLEQGVVHIYYGTGKGKTSAALGLALRAAGSGLSVFLTRFLKTSDSSELTALKKIENIELGDSPEILPFYFQMSEKQKQQYKKYALGLLSRAEEVMAEERASVIILDELLDAVSLGIIEEARVLSFLDRRPKQTEVVITGHSVSERLSGRAGYLSKITAEKHPFDSGLVARKGIEY